MRKAGMRMGMIMRSSIHAYLKGYQTFTYMAALLVFPASASLLLSQALNPPLSTNLHQLISRRLHMLFEAANFPQSSSSSAGLFFTLLDCKLTQTIFSFFFTFPFVLTFLLLAKASIICIFRHQGHGDQPENPSRRLGLYRSLLLTHLLNSFIILSVNATTFAFLSIVFNAVDLLGLSSSSNGVVLLTAAGAILYAIVVANTTVVCNLAIVVSAMDDECSGGGHLAVLKAYLLIKGRLTTALGLALVANLGMAATEALFQYRVARKYYNSSSSSLPSSSTTSLTLILEAFLVTYLHAILVVLEVIASCIFYKTCKAECVNSDLENEQEHHRELEPVEKSSSDSVNK